MKLDHIEEAQDLVRVFEKLMFVPRLKRELRSGDRARAMEAATLLVDLGDDVMMEVMDGMSMDYQHHHLRDALDIGMRCLVAARSGHALDAIEKWLTMQSAATQ